MSTGDKLLCLLDAGLASSRRFAFDPFWAWRFGCGCGWATRKTAANDVTRIISIVSIISIGPSLIRLNTTPEFHLKKVSVGHRLIFGACPKRCNTTTACDMNDNPIIIYFLPIGPNPHMQSNQNLRKLPEILQATGHARSWVISHCCLLQLPFDFAREIRLGTSWRQRRKHQIWHCPGGSWELRKDKDKVILIVAPEAFSEWRLRSGGCNPIAPKLLCKRGLERLGTYVTALPLNVWGKKSQSCKVKPEHVMFAILLMAWDDNNSFSVIIVCFSTSKQCKTAQGWVQHGVLDILDRTSMWPPFPSKLVDDSHSPSRFKSKWAHSLSSLLPKFTVVVLLSAL